MDIQKVHCGNDQSAVLTNQGLFVMGAGIFGGSNNQVMTPMRIELNNVIDVSIRKRFVKSF